MEIEDKRARSKDWVDIQEASKSPGVYEDDDGDLLLINEEGGATSLRDSPTSSAGAYTMMGAWYEKALFRRLVAKLVILGTMLLALTSCTPAQDNGFLTGCDDPRGGIDLEGECYPIQWPSVPLTVYSDGERAALDRAVERWEKRRPFQHQDLFEVVDDPTNVDVMIQTEACCSDTALGDVRFYRFGEGRISADVRVFNSLDVECVLFHELGHVLGLAHDDYGPMRPGRCTRECDPGDTECTDDALTPVDLRVTDGDHRRLNDVY